MRAMALADPMDSHGFTALQVFHLSMTAVNLEGYICYVNLFLQLLCLFYH